jgi:hypothetical protein
VEVGQGGYAKNKYWANRCEWFDDVHHPLDSINSMFPYFYRIDGIDCFLGTIESGA